MRIIHVVPAYHPAVSGAGIHVRAISERLVARGHQVAVFTRRVGTPLAETSDPGLPPAATLNGVRIQRFSASVHLPRAFVALLRMPGSYRVLLALLGREHIRMIADGPWLPRAITAALCLKPDIVTVTNWYYSSLVYQFLALKPVITVRLVGLPLFHTEESWVSSRLYPRLIAGYDAILANTEHERRFVERLVPNPPPVHTVGAGVDPTGFVHAHGGDFRLRWGLGGDPVVGYVGRMQPQKGVIRLIEAMRWVWPAVPNARLLLAGARVPEDRLGDRAFQQALAELPPAGRARVTYIGAFPDQEKASVFDACDVFAMPSTSESFGIVFLEAWLCGKPVIGARIGAVESLVHDGVDGVLLRPDDPEGLGTAIVALLRNPGWRAAMGEAGRRKALGRFTCDQITDEVEKVYRNVVVRHR